MGDILSFYTAYSDHPNAKEKKNDNMNSEFVCGTHAKANKTCQTMKFNH